MNDRDNPQETASADVGWLAGIIEGEGTVALTTSIRSHRKFQSLRVTPRVTISNTDQGLIDKSLRVLEANGIGRWVKHLQAPPVSASIQHFNPRKSYKDVIKIEVTGHKRVHRLLTLILPHMAGEKRARSELLLKFLDHRFKRTEGKQKASNVSYDEVECEMIMEFHRSTRSKNIEHYARILNDYMRGSCRARSFMRRDSLNSRESVRDN